MVGRKSSQLISSVCLSCRSSQIDVNAFYLCSRRHNCHPDTGSRAICCKDQRPEMVIARHRQLRNAVLARWGYESNREDTLISGLGWIKFTVGDACNNCLCNNHGYVICNRLTNKKILLMFDNRSVINKNTAYVRQPLV